MGEGLWKRFLYVSVCTWVQMPTEAGGVRCPDMGDGNWPWILWESRGLSAKPFPSPKQFFQSIKKKKTNLLCDVWVWVCSVWCVCMSVGSNVPQWARRGQAATSKRLFSHSTSGCGDQSQVIRLVHQAFLSAECEPSHWLQAPLFGNPSIWVLNVLLSACSLDMSLKFSSPIQGSSAPWLPGPPCP